MASPQSRVIQWPGAEVARRERLPRTDRRGSRVEGRSRYRREGSSQQYRPPLCSIVSEGVPKRPQIYERCVAAPQCFRQCGDIARHTIRAPHFFPAAHLPGEVTQVGRGTVSPRCQAPSHGVYPSSPPPPAQKSGEEEWPRGSPTALQHKNTAGAGDRERRTSNPAKWAQISKITPPTRQWL